MDLTKIFVETIEEAEIFWSAISAIVAAIGFWFAIYTFNKAQKDRVQIEKDIAELEVINAATFVLLDIEQMDRQRRTLQGMIDSNVCNLHFYGSIMSGCGTNVWPKNKAVLLNKGLDRYQVEVLDTFYAIACEIDEHLKMCKQDFYRVMRSEVTTNIVRDENGVEQEPLINFTTLQRYLNGEHSRADTCVTPQEVVDYIQNELRKLPDLSALKSVLNNIIN